MLRLIKKSILKKYVGKGGPSSSGIPTPFQSVRDTVVNGAKGVAKDIAGGINSAAKWVGGQIDKDNASRSSSAEKMRQENEDNSHGGRYTPSPSNKLVARNYMNYDAVKKAGPNPDSVNAKK